MRVLSCPVLTPWPPWPPCLPRPTWPPWPWQPWSWKLEVIWWSWRLYTRKLEVVWSHLTSNLLVLGSWRLSDQIAASIAMNEESWMSDSVSPICRYRAALAAINLEIPNRIFQHSRPKPACFLTFSNGWTEPAWYWKYHPFGTGWKFYKWQLMMFCLWWYFRLADKWQPRDCWRF